MKLYPYLTPCKKITSKYTKDLNIRTEYIELLGKNRSVNFCDLGLSNSFLDMKLKAQVTKEKK